MQNKKLLRWYYNYGFKRLTSLIQSERPDILINTFPINAVPEFRRRTGMIIPTFNVITDYCLHRLWLHDDIDKYYVSTIDLKSKILSEGVSDSKVVVSGIPIRPAFSELVDKRLLFEKYRVTPERKLIILLAGAQGVLKNIKEVCDTLLQKTEHQIAVVCGNNLSLRRGCIPWFPKTPKGSMLMDMWKGLTNYIGWQMCSFQSREALPLRRRPLSVPHLFYISRYLVRKGKMHCFSPKRELPLLLGIRKN
jgi:processive 1,2-diacylglycerol beta-glucosyltransferase